MHFSHPKIWKKASFVRFNLSTELVKTRKTINKQEKCITIIEMSLIYLPLEEKVTLDCILKRLMYLYNCHVTAGALFDQGQLLPYL